MNLNHRAAVRAAAIAACVAATLVVSTGCSSGTSSTGASSTVTSAVTVDPSQLAAEQAAESSRAAVAAASTSAQAEALRQQIAAERARQVDKSTYKELTDREWSLIAKNPSSHIGEKVVVYGKVTQFDAATGNDAFRADIDGQPQDYNIYNTNTFVEEGLSGIATDVVEGDLVTMWVRVDGDKSYDTQNGGNTTVPSLTAYIIEVTGNDK